MNEEKLSAFKNAIERGVGADVEVVPDTSGLRAGLKTHFSGLTANQGPVFAVAPTGLRRHRVSVRFGKFSGPIIEQMQAAGAERLMLARSLLQQLATMDSVDLSLTPDQPLADWGITDSGSGIDVIVRNIDQPGSETAIVRTAETVMVPLMAAMAELIGYDEVQPAEYDVEGRVTESTVIRRERSPRNRLLCLSIHGHQCAACGLKPDDMYGELGSIIEVHHLEPVSNLQEPRPYDPRTDLVPLCPNCHRAVHKRRPYPYTPAELAEIIHNVSA